MHVVRCLKQGWLPLVTPAHGRCPCAHEQCSEAGGVRLGGLMQPGLVGGDGCGKAPGWVGGWGGVMSGLNPFGPFGPPARATGHPRRRPRRTRRRMRTARPRPCAAPACRSQTGCPAAASRSARASSRCASTRTSGACCGCWRLHSPSQTTQTRCPPKLGGKGARVPAVGSCDMQGGGAGGQQAAAPGHMGPLSPPKKKTPPPPLHTHWEHTHTNVGTHPGNMGAA